MHARLPTFLYARQNSRSTRGLVHTVLVPGLYGVQVAQLLCTSTIGGAVRHACRARVRVFALLAARCCPLPMDGNVLSMWEAIQPRAHGHGQRLQPGLHTGFSLSVGYKDDAGDRSALRLYGSESGGLPDEAHEKRLAFPRAPTDCHEHTGRRCMTYSLIRSSVTDLDPRGGV